MNSTMKRRYPLNNHLSTTTHELKQMQWLLMATRSPLLKVVTKNVTAIPTKLFKRLSVSFWHHQPSSPRFITTTTECFDKSHWNAYGGVTGGHKCGVHLKEVCLYLSGKSIDPPPERVLIHPRKVTTVVEAFTSICRFLWVRGQLNTRVIHRSPSKTKTILCIKFSCSTFVIGPFIF